MALKIVRIADSENAGNPLWLWRSGQHDKALEQIARADAGAQADDARSLVELALAADLGHARAIGEALAQWSDDIGFYRLAKHAIERLLDQSQRSGPQAFPAIGLAITELGLPSLRLRPWEPVLLNYLGVALYGLGEASLALSLFQAAGKLDSSVEHLRGNIEAARQRMRKPVRVALVPSISTRLRELRRELRSIAGRATEPVTGSRVSLCMIVRDEEEMLPGCLESVQGGVDEIVIVDTGSSDRTVEIAESFGARVIRFPWTGSFSEARNVGLEAATGDHILWLDADEQLEEGDAARLRELAAQPWREAHWMVETNFTGQSEVGNATTHLALRLWRNRPHYRFTGAIHEQIRVTMPTDLGERFHASALRIRHYGYLKARIEDRDKHARNLALLRQELQRRPDDPFVHFNMGTEFVGLHELASARGHLENAYALLQRDPAWYQIGYAPLLASRLVGVLRSSGDLARADALASELLERFPGFTDLVFERGLVAGARGDRARARALFEECLELGDAPHRYSGLAGGGGFLALAALASLARESGDLRRRGAPAALARRASRVPRRRPRPGRDAARRRVGRSRRGARTPRGVRPSRAHLVAVPGHRVLRARPRRARRGALPPRARDRRAARRAPAWASSRRCSRSAATTTSSRSTAICRRAPCRSRPRSALARWQPCCGRTPRRSRPRSRRSPPARRRPTRSRPCAPSALPSQTASPSRCAPGPRRSSCARSTRSPGCRSSRPSSARCRCSAARWGTAARRPCCSPSSTSRAASTRSPGSPRWRRWRPTRTTCARSRCSPRAPSPQGLFAEAVPVLEACIALDPGQQSVQVLLAQVRGRLAA